MNQAPTKILFNVEQARPLQNGRYFMVLKAIEKRRSIRKYLDKPVEEEKLKTVLEAARLAPSWANKQCWKFLIIRDNGIKQKLADSLHQTNPATKATASAPLVIVLCANPEQSGSCSGMDYFLVDVGIALENMCLQAYELGLGTCIVGLFNEIKIKKILDIPEEYRVVALSPLGYPAYEPEQRPRKSLEEVVFDQKWGCNYK